MTIQYRVIWFDRPLLFVPTPRFFLSAHVVILEQKCGIVSSPVQQFNWTFAATIERTRKKTSDDTSPLY